MKSVTWDDTIVALATPPGVSAIGVVRLSGKNAFTIIDELFPSKNLREQPSHSLHVGFIHDEDKILDEVVVSIFKNPRSYTCLLYTSDAADERSSVDLGGRRIIKK